MTPLTPDDVAEIQRSQREVFTALQTAMLPQVLQDLRAKVQILATQSDRHSDEHEPGQEDWRPGRIRAAAYKHCLYLIDRAIEGKP